MNYKNKFQKSSLSLAIASAVVSLLATPAAAEEPCGDLGECKVLIEINSTDGDVGFHFLGDGEGFRHMKLDGPEERVFSYRTFGPLDEQLLTEVFAESAEPLCWFDEEEDEEEVRTLSEFLELWEFGEYSFRGKRQGEPWQEGSTELTNILPAAPLEVDLEIEEDDDDDMEDEPELDYTISWSMAAEGEGHLGRCSGIDEDGEVFDDELNTDFLALKGTVIEVVEKPDEWEVVLETDFNDDPEEASEEEVMLSAIYGSIVFSTRIPGDAEELEIEVPDEFIEALPPNTPVKVEVGAIAGNDNATFTELGGFCVNPDEGETSFCEEEDEED